MRGPVLLHVCRVDVTVHGGDVDRHAAVACRPAIDGLCGQFEAGFPHFLLPVVPGALPPVTGKILFGASWLYGLPRAMEREPGVFKIHGRTGVNKPAL
jgi:hypothetical protein